MTRLPRPVRSCGAHLLLLSCTLFASYQTLAAPVLGAPTHIPITSTNTVPTSVVLADINRDGDLDLVVTSACAQASCTAGFISVFLGNGNGTFKPPIDTVANQPGPRVVRVGDFNNDGNPDLITLSSCSDTCSPFFVAIPWVKVFLGHGDGTFDVLPSAPVGIGVPLSITVADFNGDGRLDVAVTSTCNRFFVSGCFETGNFVIEAFGNGDGSFQFGLFNRVPAGRFPNDLVAADFNADAKTDLAVISSNHGNVNVVLGAGNGSFSLGRSRFHTGPGASLTAADVNGDGMLDLVISAPPVVRIAYGNGDGTFQKPIGLSTAPGNSLDFQFDGNQVITGDFNGDGRVDVAVVASNLDSLFVYVNRLNGRFQKQFYSTPSGPAKLAAGDLNNDGAEDIVVLNHDSNDVAVFLSTGVAAASPSEPQ